MKKADLKGIEREDFLKNFHYNADTGVITWIAPRKKIVLGSPAFNTKQSAGYLEGGFMRKRFLAHKVAFLMHYGWAPEEVDHINIIRTDNRASNLRAANSIDNSCNKGKRVDNTSGYKGVCWDKSKGLWMCRVHYNKKTSFVGYFSCKENAYEAYLVESKILQGEFSRPL